MKNPIVTELPHQRRPTDIYMTNTARFKGKRAGVEYILRVHGWNVRGLCNKEFELQAELKLNVCDVNREINIKIVYYATRLKW